MGIRMGGATFDEMLDAVGAIQRRRVLVELLEAPDDSVHGITDSETEPQFEADSTSMQHVHLPKLENYGFIDWDQDEHVVKRGDKFDEIKPLLELLSENEERLPVDWI